MTGFCLRDAVRYCCRLPVSVHFVFELVDKCRNFTHWRSVISSQSGLGVWSLWLVIALLAVGCAVLLVGPRRLLPAAFVVFATFQIPTSIMFEGSSYEVADSVSALGGVLAVAVLSNLDPPPVRKEPGLLPGVEHEWGNTQR